MNQFIKYSTEVQGGSYTIYIPHSNHKRKTPYIRPGGSVLGLVFLKKLPLFLIGMTCIKLKHYKLMTYNKLIHKSVLIRVQFSKLIEFRGITGPKDMRITTIDMSSHNSTIDSICLHAGKWLSTGSKGALRFPSFPWISATLGISGVNGKVLGLFLRGKLLHIKSIG